MQADAISLLEILLDSEEDALLTGNFDTVETLLQDKQSLIGILNEDRSNSEEELQSVLNKISRNQALLTSAMEGIRAANARLKDFQRTRDRFETYDRSGQRHSVDTRTAPLLEKKL